MKRSSRAWKKRGNQRWKWRKKKMRRRKRAAKMRKKANLADWWAPVIESD